MDTKELEILAIMRLHLDKADGGYTCDLFPQCVVDAGKALLASAAPVEAAALTPFEIVGIAKAEGLKMRTGQGAIRFARAIEARIKGGAK